MKRWIPFVNGLALLCAATVCGTSAVLAASDIETAREPAPVSSRLQDNFTQNREPGIAELLSSRPDAGTPVSSGPVLSSAPSVSGGTEPSSAASVSSVPASSEPVSSASPSSAPPVSSEPVSSAVVSSEPVSEPPSSVPVSSQEAPSSEPEPPASSEEASSEPDEWEEPESSEPEDTDVWADQVDSALLNRVAGAVQREIVGVNTPPSPAYYEAYKAQAVASHTYMEYQRQRTGSYPEMSYADPHPATLQLVAEVLDQLLYYNGAVINAPYHAASGGATQSARYVWGYEVPYLTGVPSAYDSYDSTCRVSASALEDRLLQAGIAVDGDPEDWFDLGSITYTDGGFVNTIEICGTSVTGRTLRENLLGTSVLKSAKILDIYYDGSAFQFTTQGFGHGVGLSQQGALGYAAQEGWDYESILLHYYPGAYLG